MYLSTLFSNLFIYLFTSSFTILSWR